MKGKTCVITGANSGLGYENALALAHEGAEVVMVCRSRERGGAAREKILNETGNPKVHLIVADLAIRAEVLGAGQEIMDKWPEIDVLVNNAGIILSQRTLTPDGIEMQLAVNYLAPFLLTRLLLPALDRSGHGRVVNLSSNNHYRARMYFDDLQMKKNYQVLRAYGQTKLANILFTYELDRRLKPAGLERVEVNAVDPGFNNTGIGLKHTSFLHRLAWWLRKQQGMSAAEGAKTQIHLSASPEVTGISGTYWADMKQKRSSRASYKQEDAARLWDMSLELCEMDRYF